MADPREEIVEMIRRQLERSNPPDTEALYGRAARIDGSVRDLSLRQFNAKYVLPVKRKSKGDSEKDPAGSQPKKPEPDQEARARAREVFVQLAREVAAADRAGLIEVLEGLDGYADRVVAALTE